MSYWLLKTEPRGYSIDDLARERTTPWTGVRNYQARNFMRDNMQPGDKFLFYHSGGTAPGVVGTGKIASKPYPDPTQFEKKSHYYDPKATKEKPIWYLVDVHFEKKFKEPVTLARLRNESKLDGMVLLQRGSRLSVQPVAKTEFEHIAKLAA